jgi:hypothetical protein
MQSGYEILKRLKEQNEKDVLLKLSEAVNGSDKTCKGGGKTITLDHQSLTIHAGSSFIHFIREFLES